MWKLSVYPNPFATGRNNKCAIAYLLFYLATMCKCTGSHVSKLRRFLRVHRGLCSRTPSPVLPFRIEAMERTKFYYSSAMNAGSR